MEAPLFIIDLDGVIINTDMDTPGSAKVEESYQIIAEQTNNPSPDIKTYKKFYTEFNKSAVGMYIDKASKLFARMMNDFFGTSVDEDEFVEYRKQKRRGSYKNIVKFIGENGTWLASLPSDIQERAYILTSTPQPIVEQLDQNPNLSINSKTFSEFFGNRIITGDQVKRKKPEPEGYNMILSLVKPQANVKGYVAITFEDAPSGILAAKSADKSIFIVGIESTRSEKELKELGAHITYPALHSIDMNTLLKEAGF